MTRIPEIGLVVKVVKDSDNVGRLLAVDVNGAHVNVAQNTLQRALDEGMALKVKSMVGNLARWQTVPMREFDASGNVATANALATAQSAGMMQIPTDQQGIINFIKASYVIKPSSFKISELHWRFAVRSVLRGDNLMFMGESGFGKTMFADILAKVFERPYFKINLGATQDARSTLIGNTHYTTEQGTYVAESLFVRAIQTPNAIILLDEASRAHPDAHNILMTVLDKRQRYLRIDERDDTPTIEVAPGVTFLATANVGARYTNTRVMDHAFMERWKLLMIPFMDKNTEAELLRESFPSIDPLSVTAIVEVAEATRKDVMSDDPRLDTVISSRTTVEIAELISDGFTLAEAAEIKIFPFYDGGGGTQSPRTFVKQMVQMYLKDDGTAGARRDPFPRGNPNTGTPFSDD